MTWKQRAMIGVVAPIAFAACTYTGLENDASDEYRLLRGRQDSLWGVVKNAHVQIKAQYTALELLTPPIADGVYVVDSAALRIQQEEIRKGIFTLVTESLKLLEVENVLLDSLASRFSHSGNR